MKKAFSLIEVIFVLVILGIVASISSQIIVQVYESYIVQNALYKTSTKTELVANQIVNRLTYVIDGTTIAKDTNNPGTVEGTNWIKLENIPTTDNNFTTIEWIGYDNDSFTAGGTPYWSGVSNYETASRNSFITPGSQLGKVATIMNNLSDGEVDLSSNHPAGLIFTQKAKEYRASKPYSPMCMGLIDSNTSCIFRVVRNGDNNLSFPDALPKIVSERYKLAWSAYALVPEKNSENDYNLSLYYNYQPWNNENYEDNGTKKLLMNNVSVFKFTENGGVIQLKLCAFEKIGKDTKISSCKEKAIIR
ncbi:FIG00469922: hypothetical protein [hydrothermal vent metagenome]|uniref:Type II secretion system protein n=1 Tax=hydrothermal vent metagenome TaxID=652676 RepID=A0A1W1CVM9_9ZZZZ